MKTMKTFVQDNKVRMDDPEMVGENPNNLEWKDAYHYKCKLRHARKSMTIYFSMGYGLSQGPELEDVLNCLASDSFSVNNAGSFEEWADEFGYETDSRKAEQTYKVCVKQADKLESLLGHDAYRSLLQDTERL